MTKNKMKEDIVKKKTYKLALQKGFVYKKSKILYGSREGIIETYVDVEPTQAILQKWLRDVHNTHIGVYFFKKDKMFYLLLDGVVNDISLVPYLTYEIALEAGLVEALKLIEI